MTDRTEHGADVYDTLPEAVARLIGNIAWVVGSPRFRALHEDNIAQAEMVAIAVCDALHDPDGVYVPTGERVRAVFERQIRDNRIRDGFDGRNHAELAAKHKLSTRAVRRILERGRGR